MHQGKHHGGKSQDGRQWPLGGASGRLWFEDVCLCHLQGGRAATPDGKKCINFFHFRCYNDGGKYEKANFILLIGGRNVPSHEREFL